MEAVYFRDSTGKKVFYKNGLVQGSGITPLLFDIYLDEAMKQFLEISNMQGVKWIAYADDLMLVMDQKQTGGKVYGSSKSFFEDQWGLKINETKSGIMPLRKKIAQAGLQKKKKKDWGKVAGTFPIVESYT